MLFRGFGVPIVLVGHSRAASIYTNDWDVHLMPSIDFNSPVSSAPIDRLALGVGWVRPGVAGIGGTLNPSFTLLNTYGEGLNGGSCFEGNEE